VRQRESDLALLRSILSPANDPEVSAYERGAFAEMLAQLEGVGGDGCSKCNSQFISRLAPKQRAWANDVAARLKPIDVSKVLRGREVPTPAVLQKLPKSPPKRTT
jgi:hypothetical protein